MTTHHESDTRDMLRSAVAGGEAMVASSAARVLFEAGGRRLLSESGRSVVRAAAERTAGNVLSSAASLSAMNASRELASAVAEGAGRALARSPGALASIAARAAGREILKGAGRAAGIGFVIDGAFAGFEATTAYRRGALTRGAALKHVVKEATTGALATSVGVMCGAGLVAITGGLAAPAVFAVGAAGSIATKGLLRRLVG